MAKRKKQTTSRRNRPVVRGKSRKASRPARGKAKRSVAKPMSKKRLAKPKRTRVKKVSRKKVRPQGIPVLETTIIDVIEEPVPGVITVTEFEETDVREESVDRVQPDEDRGS